MTVRALVAQEINASPFLARWTAKGHTLCLGRWEITYQGMPIELPEERKNDDMGTWGIYSFIYDDDPDFAEGLEEDAWIVENAEWLAECFLLNDIPIDEQHMRWFYQAVNQDDWRCGSCGGCL